MKNKAYEEWIAKQPIWHDGDVFKFVLITAAIAGSLGFLIGWSYGLPDLSGIAHTGIVG